MKPQSQTTPAGSNPAIESRTPTSGAAPIKTTWDKLPPGPLNVSKVTMPDGRVLTAQELLAPAKG